MKRLVRRSSSSCARPLPNLLYRTHDAGCSAQAEPHVETQSKKFFGGMGSVKAILAREIPRTFAYREDIAGRDPVGVADLFLELSR